MAQPGAVVVMVVAVPMSRASPCDSCMVSCRCGAAPPCAAPAPAPAPAQDVGFTGWAVLLP